MCNNLLWVTGLTAGKLPYDSWPKTEVCVLSEDENRTMFICLDQSDIGCSCRAQKKTEYVYARQAVSLIISDDLKVSTATRSIGIDSR